MFLNIYTRRRSWKIFHKQKIVKPDLENAGKHHTLFLSIKVISLNKKITLEMSYTTKTNITFLTNIYNPLFLSKY